eukprot:TRINITY_DN3604_c0_g1_i2.p3 TRINITY_DN3604_c0_g1~~TRINITY_DN3604_c0_g1_i2.p3  ORF type:complete len:309 (+),score=155.93 TRINITY_DN3604_c0_g1_i2:221-1147(+)
MVDIDDIFSNYKKKKNGEKVDIVPVEGAVKKKKTKKRKAPAGEEGDAAPAAKKAKKAAAAAEAEAEAAKRTVEIDDSEFFDLRGDKHGGEIDAVLGVVEEENTERRYVAVGNLQPSVDAIYGEVFRTRLAGLSIENVVVDWVAHVVRVVFKTAEDALAGASMLDRQTVFERRIKAGLTATRDGEVLIRNILAHVTEDVITQYMSRYGTVIAIKVLSHHAVWAKAYVQYADEAHAVRAVKAMHAARNTFQDQPIFLSTTRTTTEEAARKKAAKKVKRVKKAPGAPGAAAADDDSSDDVPFVYDPNAHYA